MSKDAKLREYLSQEQFIFSKAIDLIKKGANRDTVNNNGQSLLHLLVLANVYSLIPRVLEFKGDINTHNSAGHTAFQCLLTQQPVNFESVFLLMKAGANVTPEDESILNNTPFFIDVMKLYLTIKQSPIVKDNTEQRLLTCLLRQTPINLNAVALLVFAGAGLFKKGDPVPSAIECINIIDTVNGGMSSTPIIAPNTLRTLAKDDNAKKRVINYIKSLPDNMKDELIRQGLGKTPLGFFFGVPRHLLPCTKSSGAWGKLREMQDNLYPASTYTPEIILDASSSSGSVRLDAPPPPYNPALFSSPRKSIESPQPCVFGPGSPPL